MIEKHMEREKAPDLETLLNSLGETVILLDKNAVVTYINKAGEEFFRRGVREITGRKLAGLCHGARHIAALARKAMRELRSFSTKDVETGIPGAGRADLDMYPFIADGKCSGAVLTFRENTSLVEREDPSFNSLVFLLGSIAHEIKNPLGGIRGAAQLLKSGTVKHTETQEGPVAGDNPADEYLDRIIRETKRLDGVLQNYLTIGRRPTLQPLNIHEVIEQSLTIMDIGLKNGNIAVRRHYDPSLPRVLGDGAKLLQVFVNIIKNAVEAMPRGGTITISTRPSREHAVLKGQTKRWARVSVRDTGKGIPSGEADKIFLPFYTRKKKGTGLGLALSKKIMKDHDGFIRVEKPDEGRGSIFSVYVPFCP